MKKEEYLQYLQEWYNLGLTTISISIVHYKPEKNRTIYTPYRKEYINLPEVIENLHNIGFSVRLACTLAKNYIDTPQKVQKLIDYAKANKVEQLKITPINKPDQSKNKNVSEWTNKHYLKFKEINKIQKYLAHKGIPLLRFNLGDIVYDVNGQNVCLKRCLTIDKNLENINSIIFFPDGHLRYDWQYRGAILF